MAAVQDGLVRVRSARATCRSPRPSPRLERQGYDGLYVLEQDVAITDGEPPAGEGPVRDVAKSVAFLRSLEASLSATVRPGTSAVGPDQHPPPTIARNPTTAPHFEGDTNP